MIDGYLAFDVGGTRVKSGLVDGTGSVLARRTALTEGQRGADHVLQIMQILGRQLLAEVDLHLLAIGIGFTGVIDTATGIVRMLNGKIPDITGVAVGPMIAEAFGVPTWVDNDTRVYTIGEWMFGGGQGYSNLLCLTIGTGIGTGVILNGQILRSRGLLGGILGGHITLDPDGPLCSCGNRGCLETFGSVPALTSYVRDHLTRGCQSMLSDMLESDLARLDAVHILHAAEQGDQLADFALQRWSKYLGAGLVTLIHAYDPDCVIIGGRVVQASSMLLPSLQSYITRHAWTWPQRHIIVQPAVLGDDAAILGGAALARLELERASGSATIDHAP